MNHQINPDTDPIAACLLIFARRGARIRAEQERLQSIEPIAQVQTANDDPALTQSEAEDPIEIRAS